MFSSFKANTLDNEICQPSDGKDRSPTRGRPHWASEYDMFTQAWEKDWQKFKGRRNVGGSQKKKWTEEEDRILQFAVAKYGQKWSFITGLLPNRNGKQCRERWTNYFAPGLNKEASWNSDEDLILMRKQSEIGNKWSIIAKFLPGRSVTSVKNRWSWLSRRGIPVHLQEFTEIIHKKQKEIPNNDIISVLDDAWFDNIYSEDLNFINME